MYSQIFKFKNIVWYCIIPLLLFVLLKKFIDETIIHFFVKGIFSSCYPSNLRLDVATVSLFIITIVYLAIKRSRKAILGYKSIYLLVDYILIYLLYRFSILDNTIDLTPFSFIQILKLLDSTVVVSFTTILLSLIPYVKGKSNSIEIDGFTVDEATEIETENDLLNRSKFIREIANRIVNTNSLNGSFPIGVIAAWGSGKTTFLNTLLSDLKESNPDIIRIEFNAWKCSTPTQVIETFFKQLKSQLGHFSFTFESKIQDYISNLIKGTKNEGFNSFKNVLESIFPTPSIEKQYETINNEIKRIGKKIVVFIDDLDRLDKKEIYEVIRLIRNTANFSNTFYVVAYDRNYLLNAIEEINSYQTHQFLEKIFQIEFALPPINKSLLQNEITKRLEPFLIESDLIEYKAIFETGDIVYDYDIRLNLGPVLISNVRDVVRFVNSLKLSYRFVKGEVSFVDFYNLEIIRFKHPELFIEVYRNSNYLFTTEKETNFANANFVYSLSKVKNNNEQKNETSKLEVFLKDKSDIYKLSQKDIELLVIAYSSIFPYTDKFNYHSRTDKKSLSVIKPSMYDRYFILGVEGRLSQIEFAKLRLLTPTEFAKKLENLINDQGLYSDVIEKLISIEEFDNKEDFEKTVFIILYVANLPKAGSDYASKFWGYNESLLAKLLNISERVKLYNSDSDYKHFLESILKTDIVDYRYENQFLKSLLKENIYYVQEIFSKEDLPNISIENFKSCIKKSTKATKNVWFHYHSCIERIETPTNGGVTSISYSISKTAIKIMRKFLFEHDIDGIIRASVRPTPFEKTAKLDNTISFFYRSNELFIWLLKRTKQSSNYKDEFLKFYEEWSNNEEVRKMGMPVTFFQTIPISNYYWEE